MGSQGRQLLLHFRTQGTPIMIGDHVINVLYVTVSLTEQQFIGTIKTYLPGTLNVEYTIVNNMHNISKVSDKLDQTRHFCLCPCIKHLACETTVRVYS